MSTAPSAPSGPLPHPYTAGSVRAALSYPQFRLIWTGMLLSNVGSWMQNILLPAYIRDRYNSAGLVGVMLFAQLGPMLVLSIPGGVLAARFSRQRLIVASNAAQMVGSIVLAWMVWQHASFGAVFATNLAIGVGNSLGAPAFQASIPTLVDRRDLPGAISLNSTQLNGSRVIGPVLAALLSATGIGIPGIFLINAATYLFVIGAVMKVTFPPVGARIGGQGWSQFATGLRIARDKPLVGRLIVSMTALSFFSLVYVGQMPSIVELNLGVSPLSTTYQWLYSAWGLGACLGALAAGTVLARMDKVRVIRPSMIAMGFLIGLYASLRSAAPAYPIGFILGISYFLTATALITVLQQALADNERAYVMPLWFMSFGGTVPLGNLAFGPLIDRVGARPVMYMGAVAAVVIAYCTDFTRFGTADDRGPAA